MIVLATSNADKNNSETGCLHLRFHYYFYLCGDSHVEAPSGAEAWLVISCNVATKLLRNFKERNAEALLVISCNVATKLFRNFKKKMPKRCSQQKVRSGDSRLVKGGDL